MSFRRLICVALAGFSMAAISLPAAAQSKDALDVFESFNPEVLFKGLIREDDVSLLFRHLRESMAASARGEEAQPSEAMQRRSEQIQREVAARGSVMVGVLLSAFEQAARQAVREGLSEFRGRPAPRIPADAPRSPWAD
jgi:hypothetical protein